MTAIKHDQEKARLDLVPREAIEAIARGLTFGAEKYAAHNWRQGMAYSRVVAAALRHICAWNDGENTDLESGLSHLDHAMCCLAFLSTYEKNAYYKGYDDRWNSENIKLAPGKQQSIQWQGPGVLTNLHTSDWAWQAKQERLEAKLKSSSETAKPTEWQLSQNLGMSPGIGPVSAQSSESMLKM